MARHGTERGGAAVGDLRSRYTQGVDTKTNDPRYNFDAQPTLDELAAQQGKGPITDVRLLHGDFWPEEESIEDFLVALHEWRGHKQSHRAA